MTRHGWTAADLPSQAGRTVLITGASGGIGLATAHEMARAGARVILAVRDAAKGERAAEAIGGRAEVRVLDLADLASVRAFADRWTGDLDVLVNNAGVALTPKLRTRDGFELQIGTNHLGPFALTNLLLPHVTDRVVTVASNAHKRAHVDLADLHWERRPYRPSAAYGQSKLAGLLFTLELQRRLEEAGSRVRALAAHPGAAATGLDRHLGPLPAIASATIGRFIRQSASAGALPTLYAASADLPGAAYVGPDGALEQRGHPTLVGRSTAASDPALASGLWDLSERLTGVTFPGPDSVGGPVREADRRR
jgi:NAD(P)-dependent dehydrogenase (short-subunit alcohol dehydrogenase family)